MELNNIMDNSLRSYKEGIGWFTERMPALAESFNAFSESCFKDGVLSKKQKQLIALGISLYAQDEYCIIYHVKGCLDHECTEEEILETAGVAAALGGGGTISQTVTLLKDCLNNPPQS